MNYKHYTFCNESKPDLLEFYKIVNNKKPEEKVSDQWKLLLPQNKALLDELNTMQDTEVINLSDDEPPPLEDEDLVDMTDKLDIDESTVTNIVESIKDCLDLDSSLNDILAKKLVNLNNERLEDVFTALSHQLVCESSCKIGNSILSGDLTSVKLAESFIRFILIPQLFVEYNRQIHSLFVSYQNTFSNIICKELVSKLEGDVTSTKCIQENLSGLSNTQKQRLLREFVISSMKLENNHFPIIDCLLSSEIDTESLQKLIELLTAISSIYSDNKLFGKLVLNLLSNCKGRIGRFEQQLTHIVSLHRSVWKNKLSKSLNELVQNNLSLSESMRY